MGCKKPTEALEDAEEVVAAKPDWFEGYIRRAEAFLYIKEYSNAYRCARIRKVPKSPEDPGSIPTPTGARESETILNFR